MLRSQHRPCQQIVILIPLPELCDPPRLAGGVICVSWPWPGLQTTTGRAQGLGPCGLLPAGILPSLGASCLRNHPKVMISLPHSDPLPPSAVG